ncbi:MAG: fatty acid desaturase [Bacteroidia bacterium]
MLKGKELILATKPFAKEDRSKSWTYLISTLCLVLAAITASTFSFHPMIRLGLSLFIALLLVRLFAMYHDFLHKAILKKSTAAKVIFSFFGYYTLNPPSIWRRSHDYHHKHNSKLFSSSIGSFPVYTTAQFNKLSKFEQARYLFIRHPLTILFGYIFAFWFGMCVLSLIRNPKKHWDSAIALVVHHGIGISFIVIAGWATFWFSFMIPALISSAIGAYLFYAQHNFPGVTFENKENWSYHDAALHSTSYMKMNRVMRWFTGNIGYHHIHHLNALIPFYRLPEAHKNFSEFDVVKRTSLNPRDIYHCFQVKVWDPHLNQMLRLNELRKMNKGLTDG